MVSPMHDLLISKNKIKKFIISIDSRYEPSCFYLVSLYY